MSEKPILAISAVMVGSWDKFIIARLSIVNEFSTPIVDGYLKPISKITDYKTHTSGINMGDEATARCISQVRKDLKDLMKNCIIVGYEVENILKQLGIYHPPEYIRDLSKCPLLLKKYGKKSSRGLVFLELNTVLSSAPQNSIEEAKSLLRLYLKYADQW